MGDEEEGDKDDEFRVAGFVAEKEHAEEGPGSSADQGYKDKGRLGDAPASVDRPGFIVAVELEGEEIDEN